MRYLCLEACADVDLVDLHQRLVQVVLHSSLQREVECDMQCTCTDILNPSLGFSCNTRQGSVQGQELSIIMYYKYFHDLTMFQIFNLLFVNLFYDSF